MSCMYEFGGKRIIFTNHLAPKKTIELRRCMAENPAVFAVNSQLYQAWISFWKKKPPELISKNESKVYMVFFLRTSCALSYKIYFNRNWVIFIKYQRAKSNTFCSYVYVTNYLSKFLHFSFLMRTKL